LVKQLLSLPRLVHLLVFKHLLIHALMGKAQASIASLIPVQTRYFWGVGSTAAIAAANAVAPTAGSPTAAIVLAPGAVEVLRFQRESFFSGLASSASTVYIVQGEGM
jgi:hypothetical protein